MLTIKHLGKNIISKSTSYIYHKEQNQEARRMMKLTEKNTGKLSSKNKKICSEYALDVFGHKKYAPWLMSYCSYSHEFKEGWIPDNYYGEFVVPLLKGDYGKVCDRTAIITKLIADDLSADIAYYVNNLFCAKNLNVLPSKNVVNYIFKNSQKVVFKIENSLQGKGVYFFTRDSFNIEKIKKLGNGVFQEVIEQHPFFDQFNKSALSTIRLTSVINTLGEVDIRAGYFRFGRTGDTHVLSSRQMRIPIDVELGCLWNKKLAFYPKSEFTKSLPDNDVDFSGMELPFFQKCIKEIKRLHKLIPYIRCIGWDIIVDSKNQFRIIELNGGHNGITFNEMVQGPCFKDLGWEKLHKT